MEKYEADAMYYHQYMKQTEKNQFRQSMVNDFNNHTDIKHWKVVQIKEFPAGTRILDTI